MRKIAIITSGRLPVPATMGGAVESMLDFILDYNAAHHLMDITVYSVKPDKDTDKGTAENHYVHFNTGSLWHKLRRKAFDRTLENPYYDDSMEYFLHLCIADIRKKHFDIVFLANRPGYILKLKETVDTRLVIHINNDYINTDTPRARQIKEASQLIITCSDYLNSRVRAVECSREVPIVTVYNAIDTALFMNAKPLDRKVIGLSDDDFVVMFSGRLTNDKGILELIRAIKAIHTILRLKLVIMGASFYGRDQHPTPFMQQLESEADSIRDRIVFTGFVDYRQMPAYLKAGDMAVVPSMWEEPFGLTVVEAMAAGLPLITTRSGGIPEICEGVATIISREHATEHLAEAITMLYDNPAERQRMAREAQQRALCFDKEIHARRFFETLEQYG